MSPFQPLNTSCFQKKLFICGAKGTLTGKFEVCRLPLVHSHAVEYCHYMKVHFLHHHSVFLDSLKHDIICN